MKRFYLILLVVSLQGRVALAEESANDALQKGLREEEVNQNLAGAIQAYQRALQLFEEDRKTAATATFRLRPRRRG